MWARTFKAGQKSQVPSYLPQRWVPRSRSLIPTQHTDTRSSCLPLSHSYSICSSLTRTHLKAQTFLNQYCYSLNVSSPVSLALCLHQQACVQALSKAVSTFSSFAFVHTALFPHAAPPLVWQKVSRPVDLWTFASQWTPSQREKRD